jgi:hypothetical protein
MPPEPALILPGKDEGAQEDEGFGTASRSGFSVMKSGRFLLGLAMSGLFIAVFLYRVDLGEMGHALATADYRMIPLAVVFYLFAFVWRTLRWRAILRPLGRFRFARLWPVIMVGYAANNLLPVRLGELVRAYYLGEREGASKTSALATILVERVFDGLALLFLLAVASLFVPVGDLLRGVGEQVHVNGLVLLLGMSVPFFIVCGALVALAAWPRLAARVVPRLVRWLPRRLGAATAGLAERFVVGLSALRTPQRFFIIFSLSVALWLSEAMMYFVLAFSFNIDATFASWTSLVAVVVMTVAMSNLGSAIPTSGGSVGPFEFFAQATLVSFGVGAATASAYAVIVHATQLVPITLLGLLHLWTVHLSLGRLSRASQRDEDAVKPEPSKPKRSGGVG